MAWETIMLKVPEPKKLTRVHKHSGLCPKCEGKQFAIPFQTDKSNGLPARKSIEDEKEFLILTCDRCGKFMAFEGCMGDCASCPRTRCEICGKYYCIRCGIAIDIDAEEELVKLRYCNDHIPEWYKNR